MKLKILQLNIWEGAYIDQIIEFVNQNAFDILHFQEVNGGKMSTGGRAQNPLSPPHILQDHSIIDGYQVLKKALPQYLSEQVIVWHYQDDPESYVSNVTFVNANLPILEKKEIYHNDQQSLTDDTFFPVENHPRASLAIRTEITGKKLWFINTHLAWGPTPEDADYKIEQAQVLYDFIKGLNDPFVLSGDFNMTPATQLIKMFETISINHTSNNNILNTLNPRIHKANHLFPPGLAVDMLFTSQDIVVKRLEVINDDLSDHLGIMAEIHV